MKTKTETKTSIVHLRYLPSYAQYLLTNRIDDFTSVQIEMAEEMDIPLFQFFRDLSLQQRFELIRNSAVEFLGYLAHNKAAQYLELSLKRWQDDLLPVVKKEHIVAEDITQVSLLRKKTFLHFVPDYTQDLEEGLEIIREIDLFLSVSVAEYTNYYIGLLKENIHEHAHLVEKITNTSPGIIYVYDVENNREIYANRTTTEFLGFTPEEITGMGSELVGKLIHPDDLPALKAYEQEFHTIKDGETRSFKYRFRNNKGEYRWLRTYETVFKRSTDGKVSQKIGIAIDVHQQKLTADELKQREEELLEAQEIAQLGSFTWDFEDKFSSGSPQTRKILEIEFGDHSRFMDNIHPEDRPKVEAAIQRSFETGIYECEYRYLVNGREKVIWTRGRVNYDRGRPVSMTGTLMDITEKASILNKLRENEKLFNQAEAITHIGSYKWDLQTNALVWSDELYRIYGLDPATDEARFEFISSFNHPDDTPMVRRAYRAAIAEKRPFDFYYRIRARDGQQKILHARGNMVLDEKGEVSCVIGTVQDVTEKQTLIRHLEHSRTVHRQAEELANLGSWTWDLATGTIEWSDQMYHIYDLETQSEKISFERFKTFVHPEDLPQIERITNRILTEKYSDHFFRIITPAGHVKTLHTVARLYDDDQGHPAYIVAAEQDITEKENLLAQLKKNESLYKQAEELASMGSWYYDVRNNRLEWTDHLYRIYGLQPQSEEITMERFLSFIHPEDRDRIATDVEEMTKRDLLDHTFRITTADGKTRILRSVAQVQKDQNGEAVSVVGTERDVTEKQTLIEQLTKSEQLYKQAQALAHVGNWSWDIASNTIKWSDELYRIYGEEPGRDLTYEEYLSHIHPDDYEKVTRQVQHAMATGASWEYTHKLIRSNGEMRIVHATGEVLKDSSGKPVMMIGTAQDITERQLLIEKLQESEKLFKQAQSLARLGNWAMDVKTREISWSEEMYNIFERKEHGPIQFEEWLLYLDPSEREDAVAYFEDCLREKKLYDRIHRIHLRNGKTKIIHRKGEFIFDETGTPVKIVGTTQDVTEEYRVQQELKENQTFIRKITDATPSIIASYNINSGKYVFISEGVEKLLGYEPAVVMEQGIGFFAGIIHPEDFLVINEKNQKALEEANAQPDKNDMVVEFTYRMRHKNGQYRWFHTYGTIFDRNGENKVEHVLNISLDVTEQVEAAKKIKEQEHFIQQIADASPTILYLYDVDKQSIAYINREIFFVLGYLPEEILEAHGAVTEMLYHPEDFHLLPGRKQSGKNFQQVDSMIQYECRMRNKEGEWRWVLVREIVFKTDENGHITQILGAALDINRRKEMERAILQNTLLLEQSNASLEEFAYVASHDLKEPLRKISTFGDRLLATQVERLAPDGKLYLQKIVDASQRMQTMINDLLSISMITGNTAFENYSLQNILHETLQTLEYKIEQQNAVIASDPLPEARIIPSQFRQLFQNLLSNSLKFVRSGVQPQLKIKHTYLHAQDIVHYQLAAAERYHQLQFIDNGIGFENEYAGKIFAIFQRLHGRSEYEGSGIGLAICKKIVEHHGGVIYAQGVPDEGATFTIILPA